MPGSAVERAVRRHGERSDPPGPALENVQVTVAPTQVEVQRRRAGAGAAAHSTRHEQLHRPASADSVAGNRPRARIRRVGEAPVGGGDQPARRGLAVGRYGRAFDRQAARTRYVVQRRRRAARLGHGDLAAPFTKSNPNGVTPLDGLRTGVPSAPFAPIRNTSMLWLPFSVTTRNWPSRLARIAAPPDVPALSEAEAPAFGVSARPRRRRSPRSNSTPR